MGNFKKVVLMMSAIIMAFTATVNAQEETTVAEEEESPFSISMDLVSSYVWRGSRFSGAAFQPGVEFSKGGFAIGAWGSVGFDATEAVNEADLYAGYGFDFGLSIGLSDYYYQGTPWSEIADSVSSHALEVNLGYEKAGFSIAANYMVNNSIAGAGAEDGIMYFEAGYSFKNFDVFVGAGDGWHTTTGEFEVCNLGISASKELKLSDKFSLPVSGAVIMNPQTETFHIVGTISF